MADDVVVAISSINNMAAGISGAINDLQRLQSNVQSMGGSTSPVQSSLSSLGEGFRNVLTHVTSFAGGILNAINPLNLFHSSAMRLLEVMAVWRIFEYGLQKVQEFIGGIWQLPIAMEKAQTSWAYLFNTAPSSPLTTQAAQQAWLAKGTANAAQIANWTKSYSIDIPYTRQDLIQAITTLSASNLSVQGVEQYLPVLSDIAAVRAPGVPLQYIAQAVQEGEFGLTRMLRTQLHLMPEQLAPYGYDESNFSTMLPALQKYAQAYGLTSYNAQGQDIGAAYQMAHGTFWGELSSFWDRIQNSELLTGGGDYGPFSTLKKGLEWLNNFIDAHQADIDRWAKLIGGTLSDAMKAGGIAFQGFATGLQQSGLGNALANALTGFDKWISDPKNQQGIADFTTNAGKLASALGGTVGATVAGAIKGISDNLDRLGDKWNKFIATFTPQEKQNIQGVAGALGQVAGTIAMLGIGNVLSDLTQLNLALRSFGAIGGDIQTGNWGKALSDLGTGLSHLLTGSPITWFINGIQQLPTEFGQLGYIIKFELISMWDNAIQGVAQLLPTWVRTWIYQFQINIQSGLGGMTSTFYTYGSGWMQALINGLLSGLPNLNKALQQLAGDVANSFAQNLRTPGGFRVPGIPGVG